MAGGGGVWARLSSLGFLDSGSKPGMTSSGAGCRGWDVIARIIRIPDQTHPMETSVAKIESNLKALHIKPTQQPRYYDVSLEFKAPNPASSLPPASFGALDFKQPER